MNRYEISVSKICKLIGVLFFFPTDNVLVNHGETASTDAVFTRGDPNSVNGNIDDVWSGSKC